MRRQDPSETREGETEKAKTITREDSMDVRFAQKKNNISPREFVKDLKLNVPAQTVFLIIKNSGFISCIQRNIPYGPNTSQNKTWQCAWPLRKSIFRRFHNSATVFYGYAKANTIFLNHKNVKVCGDDQVLR
ncbi:hypothetical protein AVEN_41925-1 [Araneus ventricosus]|uniref:Uncharacterized protein n=1 Tax=Araneus ventricosus TaxID=182803 RepID=A0A4Y2AEB2_ARAVE|nr:hypothetical protein AVEN_41925-1 [Araneus ventricosus]